MGIKTYRPYTPSRRQMTGSDFAEITKTTPEKSLLAPKSRQAGRNNQGKITVRHRGGGAKKKYRIIDFKRNKDGIAATVIGIEYDPNRTANIALICYEDGEKAYILAPEGLKDGMKVMNGPEAEVRVGNCLPLSEIPVGTQIHNIELYPGKGGQLVRSAGNSAQLMAKEGKYATLRLPSGEMRMVPIICRASVGVVGNGDHSLINVGKAGRKRHMGFRPTVRGSVMNPNDHPHGGGEGKTGIGRPGPSTPWGKPALGLKTRKKNKASNKLIVRRRDGKAIKYTVLPEGKPTGSFPEKRTSRRCEFTEQGRSYERIRRQVCYQDLVPPFHNFPDDDRSHNRRSRRKKTCSGIYHRRYGWTQTW